MNVQKHSELQEKIQTLVSAFHATPPCECIGCPYHKKPQQKKSIEEQCDQLLCKSKESTSIPTPVKISKDEDGFITPPPRNTEKNLNFTNINSLKSH
ncbi:hypothetical protein NPIL_270291 [Nephila pilipes]|uniref:Uncharacterized protein n=1 Tax=Nephila pilipes TaxID=299642 RepID=A0A8X6NKC3_NEPPI|nr:hypothetical protein NPIL_270291 [Nephila pilipes]